MRWLENNMQRAVLRITPGAERLADHVYGETEEVARDAERE